jgi:transglutaminase-like putative cysteine protease
VVPGWARGTWRAHGARLRAAIDWRLAGLGVAAYGVLVVVSGLLFLAIPRFEIQSSLFLDQLISRTTKTGFSENIRFGEVTSISQDDSLAFAVDIADPTLMPAVPYWRMVVLDEYTGEGFRISNRYRRDLNLINTARVRINGTRLRPDFTSPTWTFFMEPGISRYLPLLGDFYTMSFTEPQMFGFHEQLRVVALRSEPPKMFAYQTWNMGTEATMLDASFALSLEDNPYLVEPFLRLPEDPTVQAHLREVLERISPELSHDVTSFGAATIAWLESTHPYALDSMVPPGSGDALLRWLDSEAPGHCEFFAGSMVLLARSAGLPARIVTGFRGGSWNDFSGSFMVRNSNAHAWVEIFDRDRNSWIRFDPTPGNQALADRAVAEEITAASLARDQSWNARLESLRVFWYRRIVNFDIDTQEALLTSTQSFFRTKTKEWAAWVDGRFIALRQWAREPWDRQRLATLGGGLLGLVGLIVLWRRYGAAWWLGLLRRTARLSTRSTDHDPVRREASRWLQRGRRNEAFTWPDKLEGALLRLRFGDDASWPDPASIFRAARKALRETR